MTGAARLVALVAGAVALLLPSTATAAVDFSIAGIERNQVVQTINQDIPLVYGKPTGVRVYVKASGDNGPNLDRSWTVGGALLDVYSPTGQYVGTLQPVNTTVRAIPTTVSAFNVVALTRSDIKRSFNFRIPQSMQYPGGIRIVASINNSRTVAETSYSNNTSMKTLSFVRTGYLRIHGLQFASPQHPCSSAVWSDIVFQATNLLRVYPVDGVSISGRDNCLYYSKRLTTGAVDDDYFPGTEAVVIRADQLRDSSDTYSERTWFVLTPWDINADGRAVFNNPPGAAIANDNGGPNADLRGLPSAGSPGMTMAQEIAHAQHGLLHTGHTSVFPDPNCCPSGAINGLYPSTMGLDPLTMTLFDPAKHAANDTGPHDFMSYGVAPRWVSDYTYLNIINAQLQQVANRRRTEAHRGATPRRDYLFVTGELSPTPRIGPTYVLDKPAGFADESGQGAYSLDLLDANGNVIFTRNFDRGDSGHGEVASFSQAIPHDPAVRSVVLRQGTTTLATRQASGHAPTVEITKPTPGAHWSGDREVAWTAADADGDELSYMVQYSADGGQTWLTLASDLTEPKLAVDADLIQGSTDCRVRVLASDGLNSTAAVSEPFGVDRHTPTARIIIARRDRSGAVHLVGSAADPDDGDLPRRRVVWRSNRSGVLGRGEELVTRPLPAGRHRIKLTVTDSEANRATATVRVRIRDRGFPAAPREVRRRGSGDRVRLSWTGRIDRHAAYVVQRAHRARARKFVTIARLRRGEHRYTDRLGLRGDSYRVGACNMRGCSDFARARPR